MSIKNIININQYLITEWFNVVITRVQCFEKVLETEMLLTFA
ncbi:hypothetical protein STAIW_v1c01680 [Spiroplasma taiwanense CT-1]|uniref:Uncharacterized protein n=1 Tax=Spiroplasma taiwanense CT-1 TaxID=1276220 RepID=S5MG63_9MOLU|nr:hypothetical protein STAIW_v1c01680 [Spiroplasma taiwanense CT-1]